MDLSPRGYTRRWGQLIPAEILYLFIYLFIYFFTYLFIYLLVYKSRQSSFKSTRLNIVELLYIAIQIRICTC